MSKLVIHNILYPQNKSLPTRDLYFKKSSNVLSFQTYFNSFPIVKWEKYTSLSNLHLQLEIKGSCEIVFSEEKKDSTKPEILFKKTFTEKIDIEIPYSKENSFILSFELGNLSEDFCFFSGSFYTLAEKEHSRAINLGIGICTYKREKNLIYNINNLQSHIIENKDSILYNNIKIYIADNGNTIKKAIETENIKLNNRIHIYPNINAGGAAGFTRCIIEFFKDKNKPSHILLMDDDVSFEPETINRTASFLKLLKPKFYNDFISGAMLKEENPTIQQECGANWDLSHCSFPRIIGKGYDLTNWTTVKENLIEKNANYSAWFFCCMPIGTFQKNGLPLPFFIHFDDIEYGLRCKENVISVNGICVWHPTENKYSPNMTFYDTRNSIATSFLRDNNANTRFNLIFLCLKRFIDTITTYRYIEWELFYKAVNDIIHISRNTFNDPIKTHSLVISKNYQSVPISEISCPKKGISNKERTKIATYFKKRDFIKKLDTIISLFLLSVPSFKKDLCIMNTTPPFFHPFFRGRKRVYIYNKTTRTAFLLEKNAAKTIVMFVHLFSLCFGIFFNYSKARKNTNLYLQATTSNNFWSKHLLLD